MSGNIGILDPKGKNPNPLTGNPYSDAYRDMAKVWSSLPAYVDASKMIDQIRAHNVILVVSGTGSGKTVLFPNYLMHCFDYKARIAITLPKKSSARSSAQYEADLMDVKLGEEVGYQYRNAGKNTRSDKTKMLYCTDGTLVARLINDPLIKDLDGVIIDEAHERKVNIDFLMYLLRDVLDRRPEFKLIIMSATINQDVFKTYYKKYKYTEMSIGTKPNFPIKSTFLDTELNIGKGEYLTKGIELIQKLMKEKDDGGILFFVTSINETNQLCEQLADLDKSFKDTNVCIPVFSGMDDEAQKMVSDKDYYRGFVKNGRKILVATNVAESSLTIKGIVYVIDSGLELKSSFDPVTRVNILEKGMITHAQATQRMGRTGRTSAGYCYHLYTEKMFTTQMERFPAPSIRNESIGADILRLMGIEGQNQVKTIKEIFSRFPEPPKTHSIEMEFRYLGQLKLIDSDRQDGTLTHMGAMIAYLNIEPSIGMALIAGYRLNCFREVSAIVSVIHETKGSIGSLFVVSDQSANDVNKPAGRHDAKQGKQGKQSANKSNSSKWIVDKFEKKKREFADKTGDHISILKIFREYEANRQNEEQAKQWAYDNFAKRRVFADIYQTYSRMKQQTRDKLSKMDLKKADQAILSMDIKDRIVACFVYGYKYNVLKISDHRIETMDGKVKNIQIDASSYVDVKTINGKALIYDQLYRYNNTPVKAKVVSFITEPSLKLVGVL